MVPTLTCGLDRSNFSLAMSQEPRALVMLSRPSLFFHGADDQDRTGDLVLTKDVLCQLSYIGLRAFGASAGQVGRSVRPRPALARWLAQTKLVGEASERSLERETGIEPATNSLEGCDSTTELLPPSRLARCARSALRRGKPANLSSRRAGHSTHPTRVPMACPAEARVAARRVLRAASRA